MLRLAAVAALLVAGCATTPPSSSPDRLFADALFAPASERVSASDVFALSDEMRRYVSDEMASEVRTKGLRKGLVDAILGRGGLKLEYDSLVTRNAAQAFAARSGNCLSLVIMTGALARELGLPVWYQSVVTADAITRIGDVDFFVGHVNIVVRDRYSAGVGVGRGDLAVIDFLPPSDAQRLHARTIEERTIVAMYMNNRAAEALVRGHVDDAYWWAREAIREDPPFVSAYNTLGVVYLRHGNGAEAERVLSYAISREPGNANVMTNLVRALRQTGRDGEAVALEARLRQLEPDPPFSFFDRGMRALERGAFADARELFVKEIARAPYYSEFHFALAAAYHGLGDAKRAREELDLALEYSTTHSERDLYAAKLERLASHR